VHTDTDNPAEVLLTDKPLSVSERHSREVFAVVSGSFRRFLPQVQDTVAELSLLNITVLSPQTGKPVADIDGFVVLDTDKGSPAQIEKEHLSAISRSDFLYVVNPDGAVGPSVALEIGYALAHRVPVYSMKEATDEVFRSMMVPGVSLSAIRRRVRRLKGSTACTLKAAPTLGDLQAFVATAVKRRGFAEEGLVDVALLLVEEVGELAKAIRVETGLKVAPDDMRRCPSLRLELADCLIYLADLANLANISLEDALREKEALNAGRRWAKHPSVDSTEVDRDPDI